MSENSFISLTLNHLDSGLVIKWGGSPRWSFGVDSAWGSIEKTTIGKTQGLGCLIYGISKRCQFSRYSASSGRMQANSSDSVIFLTVVLFPSYSSSALQEQYHPSIAFA